MGPEEVHDLAARDTDLEVYALRSLRVKSLMDPLKGTALGVLVLGGLAAAFYHQVPLLALGMVVSLSLVEVYIVLMAADGVAFAFRRGPVILLTREALWVARVGWIDWEELKGVAVFRLRPDSEADIGLVAKDPAFVRRLPWLAWIAARTAGLPLAGAAVTLPYDRLSVSGEALLDYIRTRYGSRLQAVPVGPPLAG